MWGHDFIGYQEEPTVIIGTDDLSLAGPATSAVLAAGGRVLATVGCDQILARLADQRAPDSLLLELSTDTGASLDALLDAVDSLSASSNIPLIVSVTPDLIDAAVARLNNPLAALLCNPSAADRIAGLALAWTRRGHSVHDRGPDLDGVRLQSIADEVGRIARTLATLGEGGGFVPRTSGLSDAVMAFKPEPAVVSTTPISASEIRTMIRLRRMRERFFDAELFADPAWDMMLDLMAARAEHVRVSVSSLCIAAAVPATTALRWIKTLTDQGIFTRVADPTDGRRVFIELSDTAAARIGKYFAAVKGAAAPIV